MDPHDYLEFYMYVDQQSMDAYQTGRPTWLADNDWRNDGIDNRLFSGDVVPFAENAQDALKKFAMAHRIGCVVGPPVLLIEGRLAAAYALGHLKNGDIVILHDRPQPTIAFAKPVNHINYPNMVVNVYLLEPDEGSTVLAQGLQLVLPHPSAAGKG